MHLLSILQPKGAPKCQNLKYVVLIYDEDVSEPNMMLQNLFGGAVYAIAV